MNAPDVQTVAQAPGAICINLYKLNGNITPRADFLRDNRDDDLAQRIPPGVL